MITATTPDTPALLNAAAASAPKNETVLASDFDTFLKMLTTQVMNQDPLNPIDSSDYAAQLAQFSSVEQQVLTNDLLTNLASMLGTNGFGDLAGWIGREVRSDAPAYFDGTPVELSLAQAPAADDFVLEVYDDRGTLVQSIPLSPGLTRVDWSGTDDQGAPFPPGQYSFLVDNRVAGESIGVTKVATYNHVIEARVDSGQMYLMLEGGHRLTTDSVTGIRG